MAKNRNNLKERIRRGAGNPRNDIVTDADIDYFIDEAIEEISRHAPAWEFSSLTTEAGVQAYALTEGLYDVCYCYYVQGLLVSDIFGEDFEDLTGIGEALSYDVEMTRYSQYIDSLRKHEIMKFYDWEYNLYDKKLYLINPPDYGGDKVYYVGLRKWTFETIPDRFERYLQMFGVYRTLEQYARTQRRETSISHGGAGEPWTQATEMLADARRVKEEFDNYMLVEGRKLAIFLGD